MVRVEARELDEYGQEKLQKDESENSEDDEPPTNWTKVGVAGLIWFLSAIEHTVIGMSEWPYMHQVDPEATSSFFGFVASSSKTGHAIFALVFSMWSYKMKHIKMPMIVGRVIALVACILYLGVEMLPHNRRYLMLFCYFLFGVGYSATTVLRSYIAEVSHPKDRSRAYAVTVIAHLVAIVIGPIIQLCFTRIPYPGFDIIPDRMRFHIYSAPIWIALATNIVALVLVCFVFEEPSQKYQRKEKSIEKKPIWERVKKAVYNKELPWTLVFIIWFQKMLSQMSITTISTTASPLCMVAFGWDGPKTVTVLAFAQGAVGLLSVGLSAAYVVFKLGHKLSARLSLLIGLCITILLYLLTYPYPHISRPIPAYNETTRIGCDPKEYDWCDSETTTPYVWIPVLVVVLGLGLPFSVISVDTIYSKLLGNIDQNLMQGLIIFMEDIVLIVGPIYSAILFTASGQTVLWIVNGVITLIGLLSWIAVYHKFEPYR